MLNAQELRSKIGRLLAQVREEHAAIQRSCTEGVAEGSKPTSITSYLENIHEIRRQLQELVGDTAATAMIESELGTHLKPPKLPTGYVALSTPRPLIGEQDNLWIALADHSDLGLLIYEEHFCRAFLVAEECLTLHYTLMQYTQKFFDLATTEYLNNPIHQSDLAKLRNWLNQKTEQE